MKLEELDVSNKTVLVRADLNVPMRGGRVTDMTRINRLLPTLQHLMKRNAKIVLISHFGRPQGQFVPSLSLAPLVDALSEALGGKDIKFGSDCVDVDAKQAVASLQTGDIVLLENLRFHPEEEAGDRQFAQQLASHADIYVNDAFSCSHRAHASISVIAEFLPSCAGLLLREETELLARVFGDAQKPIAAVIGGSKVSTKLSLLENLATTMDVMLIGGAMAHTFMLAQGKKVGASLCEKNMKKTALKVLETAKKHGCEIILPDDFVVAETFEKHAVCEVVAADAIPNEKMAIDIGPQTVARFAHALESCKTVVWNGPMGAFETSPFDASTIGLIRTVAGLTAQGKIQSIAGGGDTVSAIRHAGLMDGFSYVSTAGGAFLEWLEGKTLPGIAALEQHTKAA